MNRFGLRFGKSVVPTVEVTVREYHGGASTITYAVVRRVRGFTQAQAMRRALAWTRKHGDPR